MKIDFNSEGGDVPFTKSIEGPSHIAYSFKYSISGPNFSQHDTLKIGFKIVEPENGVPQLEVSFDTKDEFKALFDGIYSDNFFDNTSPSRLLKGLVTNINKYAAQRAVSAQMEFGFETPAAFNVALNCMYINFERHDIIKSDKAIVSIGGNMLDWFLPHHFSSITLQDLWMISSLNQTHTDN